MPFDFPNSPTTNQVVTGVGGIMFVWDGVKWVASTTGAVVSAGVTSFNTRTGAVTLTTADVTTIADPIYLKPAAADTAYVNVTGDTMTGALTASGLEVRSGSYPQMYWYNSSNGADLKRAGAYLNDTSGAFNLQFINDANTIGSGFMTVTRSGYATQALALVAPTINLTGEVLGSGNIFANGGFYPGSAASGNGYALFMSGGSPVIRFSADNWHLAWDNTNGNLNYFNNAGTLLSQFFGTGGMWGSDSGNFAQVVCRSNLGILYEALTGYWIGFQWDGTNVPVVINGAYAATLVSATWCNGQFLNIGSGKIPTNANQLQYTYIAPWVYLSGYDGTPAWYYCQTTSSSDARIKENIQTTSVDALARLREIPVRSMDIRAEVVAWMSGKPDATKQHLPIGLVAQELAEVIPSAVVVLDQRRDGTTQPPDSPLPDDMRGIEDRAFTAYFVRAIQQLADEVDALKASIR